MADRDESRRDVQPAEPDRDVPKTPDELIDHARLTAQARGKARLPEQIDVIDALIAQRCSSARARVAEYGTEHWDWETWGRMTYVLESALSFLERIDKDPEARDYLAKRFRYRG